MSPLGTNNTQTSKEQPLFLTVFSSSFYSAELLILFSHPFLLPSFWVGNMYVDTLVPDSYWILSLFTFLYHLTGSTKMITNHTDLIRAAFFFYLVVVLVYSCWLALRAPLLKSLYRSMWVWFLDTAWRGHFQFVTFPNTISIFHLSLNKKGRIFLCVCAQEVIYITQWVPLYELLYVAPFILFTRPPFGSFFIQWWLITAQVSLSKLWLESLASNSPPALQEAHEAQLLNPNLSLLLFFSLFLSPLPTSNWFLDMCASLPDILNSLWNEE